MKAADFVGHLFLARDVTHSVHLNTRSYAKHVALNEFYDAIVDLADKFAEAYQGRHGLVGDDPQAIGAGLDQVSVVRHQDHSAGVGIDRCDERGAAVDVEMVGRLIEHGEMRP